MQPPQSSPIPPNQAPPIPSVPANVNAPTVPPAAQQPVAQPVTTPSAAPPPTGQPNIAQVAVPPQPVVAQPVPVVAQPTTPPPVPQQQPVQPTAVQPAIAQPVPAHTTASQPAASQPAVAQVAAGVQSQIPRPVPATQTASQQVAAPVAAQKPQKTLPPWLMPFATLQPGSPIDSANKLGVFSGITSALMAPLVYGATVGLTAFGMWYHFVHNKHLLETGSTMPMLTFYGPIIGGTVLLLFFIAPFFLSRPQKQTTYRIDTNENPALLALVEAVASHVGAPIPTRISASLDNTIRVEKTDDSQLEVFLGLPLVAVQSARQTSGFLAHEFYKFSSRPSAKSWGLTNIVRGLFGRAAYECGEAHQEVVEWGATRRKSANVTFGFLPWLFDQLVAIFSDDLTETMILDADRSQTRVAGSNTFAMSQLDKRLLDELVIMSQEGFSAARKAAQKSENLPAFYANKLNILKTEQPDYVKRICQDLMETKGETKPCMANRIAVAQNYKDEGIFPADKPAAGLFKDFTRLCRSTTALHYDRHFGTEIELTKLRLTEESARVAAEKAAAEAKEKSDAEAAIAAHAQAQQDAARQAALQTQQAAIPQAIPVAQQPVLNAPNTGQIPNAAVAPAAPIAPPVPPVAPVVAVASAAAAASTAVPQVTPPTPAPAPAPIPAEQLPAVPAAAAVPTVAAGAASENWTGQDDASQQPIEPRAVAEANPVSNIGRNYLHAFLQTDVLTSNHDLFLPIDETSVAPDPEQAARALLASRKRYEEVYVARKPELSQIATGRMRLRSLQMARTMSLVGLPIGAESLGLTEGTNAAAAAACDQQIQTLKGFHDRLKELTDQATTRFVMATQLAETQIVAQSVGFQPHEVQSCRIAVSCLGQLRNILPQINDLGRQQRQLRCLVFNLNGNEHREELTTSLSLTAVELAESMVQLHKSLPAMTHYAQSLGIAVPPITMPDNADYQGLIKESGRLLTLYDQLYQQSFATMAYVAERIEQHFGANPLAEPKTTGDRTTV